MLTPGIVFFALRLLLAALLYTFLGGLLWYLYRDLRTAERAAEARSRRMGRLIVIESRLGAVPAGVSFGLQTVTALGRAPTNTVVLPDDTVSLEHALLHFRDNQWWLEDLDSRNSTRLNEIAVTQPMPVVTGDLIGVGRVKLKLELD